MGARRPGRNGDTKLAASPLKLSSAEGGFSALGVCESLLLGSGTLVLGDSRPPSFSSVTLVVVESFFGVSE